MNKKWAIFIALISAVITLIFATGYGYIFKAIGINPKNGSLSPSTDIRNLSKKQIIILISSRKDFFKIYRW